VVTLRACAFGCKVTKSRNVITVDVESNFKAEALEAQTILLLQRIYDLHITRNGLGSMTRSGLQEDIILKPRLLLEV
jgi:hypothetical protein